MILEIKGVSKSFGKRKVLSDVSFTADAGQITGFLGPNGAGKTTAIKVILGLLKADSGTVTINGYDINAEHDKALHGVGAIVESPDLYTYLTGRENLMQFARIQGVSSDRVEAVAEMVRLQGRLNDKVKGYSLGMRQRLGLAQALLGKPDLLILDEPTNGLDPAGIKELRDVLKDCAASGCAVLVSSHQLSEMELMCNRICIIENGTVIAVRDIGELTKAKQDTGYRYTISVSDTEAALKVASDAGFNVSATDGKIVAMLTNSEAAALNKALILGGVDVIEFEFEHRTLEDAFLEITGGSSAQIK